MVQTGRLEKDGRGIYQIPDKPLSEHAGMEIVATKVPHAAFCLLTALQFHDLTTQLPRQIWITLPQGSHAPKISYPPIRMIQCAPLHFEEGIENHRRGQHESGYTEWPERLPTASSIVTRSGWMSPWKHKAGLEQKKVTADDLWHYAKIARVTNVVRPYIEALT